MEERRAEVTPLIPDASAVGAYLLPDEDSSLLPGLTDALADRVLVVPPHWHFEVANLALMAMRRKRLFESEVAGLAEVVRGLRIEIDPLGGLDAWDRVMSLAITHQLTIYDAAYLALAQRRSLPLATFDARLVNAAAAENVELFGR